MRKLHFLLFVGALSCFVMGCRKPVEVSFDDNSKTIAAEGGTCTVELKSNGDWTIGSTAEWLRVSPTSGNGDATITIEVQPNLTEQVRIQEITATTKDNMASVTISQEAGGDPAPEPYINLSPNSMLGDWEGGSFQVVIRANIAWTVTALPEWVNCSVMEGEGDDTLWMTMQPYLELGNREAYITFGDENTSAQFHVRQTGSSSVQHFLTVTPNELQVACSGESFTLTVTSDEAWVAIAEMNWTVLDITEGEGNATIMLTVEENPLYVERQGSIKFLSESNAAVVDINQEASPNPHYLEVSPLEIVFGSEGGGRNVIIECDEEWEVDGLEEWLTASMIQGTGNGTVTLTAALNVYNETRMAVVTIVSRNITRSVNVMQEPGEETYWAAVSPDSLFVGRAGGVRSFSITSNATWTISVPSWVTLPPQSDSGTGDATIEMMVGSNSAYSNRVGYILVMRNSEELARVVVVQEGVTPVLSADVEEIVFTREGGAQYFNLTSNISWMINNSVDWLVCDPMEGAGNAEVLVKASPMVETESRETVLVVRGLMGQTTNVVVRQTN